MSNPKEQESRSCGKCFYKDYQDVGIINCVNCVGYSNFQLSGKKPEPEQEKPLEYDKRLNFLTHDPTMKPEDFIISQGAEALIKQAKQEGIKRGEAKGIAKAVKITESLRNPYPKDVFIEPTKEQFEKFNAYCKKGGWTIDAFSGSWGRRVFDLCKEDILEALQETIEDNGGKQ